MEKPNHQTTPIGNTVPANEIVTIIDPRHPLCGQKMRLICVENRSYLGHCCVLWQEDGCERHIPVEATDLSPEILTFYPLPIDISSVERLLSAYARLIAQLAKGTEDGFPTQPLAVAQPIPFDHLAIIDHPDCQRSDQVSSPLGCADTSTATELLQHDHPGMSPSRRKRASVRLRGRGGAQ